MTRSQSSAGARTVVRAADPDRGAAPVEHGPLGRPLEHPDADDRADEGLGRRGRRGRPARISPRGTDPELDYAPATAGRDPLGPGPHG